MSRYIVLESMVFELHDMRIVCLLRAARMGYKYGFIHVINRLYITSQGQMSFIGLASMYLSCI